MAHARKAMTRPHLLLRAFDRLQQLSFTHILLSDCGLKLAKAPTCSLSLFFVQGAQAQHLLTSFCVSTSGVLGDAMDELPCEMR